MSNEYPLPVTVCVCVCVWAFCSSDTAHEGHVCEGGGSGRDLKDWTLVCKVEGLGSLLGV